MVPPNPKPRRVLVAVTLATITIFGGLIALMTWELRVRLRREVLQREAEAIHAVALMHLERAEEQLGNFSAEFVIDDLFAAVLESSRLRGVLAVQLFDPKGKLRKAEPLPPEDAEATKWWSEPLREPRAHFIRHGTLERVSPLRAVQTPNAGPLALLDVAVPLQRDPRQPGPLGVARYWIEGESVRKEFAKMDRGLVTQAAIAFGAGAALVAFVLGWAFSRLAEVNRRLVEQSADLARANEELDFAAKTGALGAISAHLIHGLKNPLAGLEGFVAETATGAPEALRGDAARTAMETTRRLRALVTEVTTVLRDESDGAAGYAVPVIEVVEAARTRVAPAAERNGVSVDLKAEPDVAVTARVANLVGLVLANLSMNAIEAMTDGGTVQIEAKRAGELAEFFVHDTGPGIPQYVQAGLFRPVRSSKRGGGGVGLAISLRLAKHAGGNLELVRSDGTGTHFRLVVPRLIASA